MAASDITIPASTLCRAIRRVAAGQRRDLAEAVEPVDGEHRVGSLG